jgi:hypothetical protein
LEAVVVAYASAPSNGTPGAPPKRAAATGKRMTAYEDGPNLLVLLFNVLAQTAGVEVADTVLEVSVEPICFVTALRRITPRPVWR